MASAGRKLARTACSGVRSPIGTYQPSTRGTVCLVCSSGTAAPSSGSSQCDDCAPVSANLGALTPNGVRTGQVHERHRRDGLLAVLQGWCIVSPLLRHELNCRACIKIAPGRTSASRVLPARQRRQLVRASVRTANPGSLCHTLAHSSVCLATRSAVKLAVC